MVEPSKQHSVPPGILLCLGAQPRQTGLNGSPSSYMWGVQENRVHFFFWGGGETCIRIAIFLGSVLYEICPAFRELPLLKLHHMSYPDSSVCSGDLQVPSSESSAVNRSRKTCQSPSVLTQSN